ncbi:MAG: hypothetical protein JWQ43_1015 [Glaciihabitans sp.]|nr:hypothetical protein [Glaciihabitans sp.]
MRWDDLFDDLESQLEQEIGADDVDFRAEEERLRLARLGMRDRLLSLHAAATILSSPVLRLNLRDGTRLAVAPTTFGRDWFSADIVDGGPRSRGCIVPIDAIAGLTLSREQTDASLQSPADDAAERSLSARLGLGFVLRDLCRRRHGLQVNLQDGSLSGTIDRVGRDHFDLAVHEAGSARRAAAVTEYRVLRFSELILVRL